MTSRRRLHIVAAPVLSHGGGIRHVAAIARAAGDLGWDVEVRVARRPGCAPVTQLVNTAAPSARVVEAEMGERAAIKAALTWCVAAGRDRAVLYAALPQTVVAAHRFGLRLRNRPRVIVAAQGLMIHDEGTPARRRLMTAGLRGALNDRACLVASVSQFTATANGQAVGANIDPARVHVLGNVAYGIGDAPWVAPHAPDHAGRKDIVGILARLSPEKGVDVAIRAVASDTSATTLEIGGDGPERATLEVLARELGVADRVRFLGWISDPLPLLARWRALSIPSRTEGLPLALIEAAWAGCPVVASAVGGLPEAAVAAGGITLVEAGDHLALAQAFRTCSSGPAPDPSAFGWRLFSDRVRGLLKAASN